VILITAEDTGASSPEESGASGGEAADAVDDWSNDEPVKEAFCQVIQKLCSRLDATDFRLSATLAAGSLWASLEVLGAHRIKLESTGPVNYALQSVTSTVKSWLTSEEQPRPQLHKHEWKEHHFALHVFRKHVIEATLFSKNSNLRSSVELAMLEQEADLGSGGDAVDGEEKIGAPLGKLVRQTDDDIPEAICDGVIDSTLEGLAAFVPYCDPMQTPPVLAAAMVRALLISKDRVRASSLFEAVFVRSRKAQAMVVTGQVPVDFLCAVKAHRVAARVLRQLLSRYENLGRAELRHLLDHVLLKEFAVEPHFQELLLTNHLVQDLVVHCRVATRAAEHGNSDASKLREVGERLFAASFVHHHGFLPASATTADGCIAGTGDECPWDSGDLDLPLLAHAPQSEDSLHLARCVLLRGLLRRQSSGRDSSVPAIQMVWPLGSWQSCRDAALVLEAFRFLKVIWMEQRQRQVAAGVTTPSPAEDSAPACSGAAVEAKVLLTQWATDQETLFAMFADLELWLLPPRELLTPWIPPQILASRIAHRCRELEEQQRAITAGNRANLEEINRLRQTVGQLSTKLDATDQRSLQSMQKQVEVGAALQALR